MKKISIFILLTMLIVIVLSSCTDYTGWKKVEIEGYGTLMVPEEWVYTEKDGLSYFTDKPMDEYGYVIYLMEVKSYYDEAVDKTYIENEFFGGAEAIELVENVGYSNSVMYCVYKYMYEGNEINRASIDIPTSDMTEEKYLTNWEDNVDYEILKKIANSYEMYY